MIQRLQQKPPKTRMLTLTMNIINDTGFLSLWKGTLATLLRNVPGTALYFTTLHYSRILLTPICTTASTDLLSGSLSRAAIGLLLMPMTVLKTRFESNLFKYDSIPSAFKIIYKTEGLRGFLSGWGVTTLRDAPYAGSYVFFYGRLKPILHNTGLETNTCNFINGMIAGSISTTLFHPIDVIKTRVQLNPQNGTNNNMWKTLASMLKSEKLESFFSGYLARGTRKVLSGAITWTVYEYCTSIK